MVREWMIDWIYPCNSKRHKKLIRLSVFHNYHITAVYMEITAKLDCIWILYLNINKAQKLTQIIVENTEKVTCHFQGSDVLHSTG